MMTASWRFYKLLRSEAERLTQAPRIRYPPTPTRAERQGESAGYFNVEMFVQHSKQFVQNLSTVPNLFYQIRRFVFHKLNSRGFGGIYRLVYV